MTAIETQSGIFIYVSRKRKLFLAKGSSSLPDVYVSSLLKNISGLGFTFSPALTENVRTLTLDQLRVFHDQLIAGLKLLVGAHVKYEPMYPNFPEQVMKADESELYQNALLHYFGDWVGARILPQYEKLERALFQDQRELSVIDLGSVEEFESLFTQSVASKTSLSASDKVEIDWFVATYVHDIARLLPSVIPNKENFAYVSARLIQATELADSVIGKHCRTATDVLRIAVALSGGDVSLAETGKFGKFSRKQRKMLLRLLEQSSLSLDDMLKYKEVWKRLGERLHPKEYRRTFPKSDQVFDVLRNDLPHQTFNGRIEKAIKANDPEAAAKLLSSRPGELARRLDHLLRSSGSDDFILKQFDEVARKVSSPVLLQVLTHFEYRNHEKDIRVFFPKGNVGKAAAIPYNLIAIPEERRLKVVAICRKHLIDRYKELPSLGKVYIDAGLRRFTVPFAMRSASKALKTISRGSRLHLPEGNTIRFFIWWRDGVSRTDIDLSAVGLDAQHNLNTVISYYNLASLGGYHSGDITSAPEGASEFIDIDIKKFLESGIRYVMMSVNSFTHQPFCDLPECFAGVMVRQHSNSGEIYEPRSVENKIDLTSNTKVCIPMIIDLQERSMIWTDLGLAHAPGVNNVHGNLAAVTVLSKAMTSLVKTSLFDLFHLHAAARGEIVSDKSQADIIFAVNEGITPFDSQRITSQFL